MSLEEITSAVIAGQPEKVKELTQKALDEKIDPDSIINDAFIAGMNVVGKRFKEGEMYVPEVLMAAKAMSAGMELVKPLVTGQSIPSKGTIVIGTVKGDLHDIGKNLVAMMLEGSGFEVINLGVDVAPERFVAVAKEKNAQIIGMSALLTTTMLCMKDTIEVLKEEGLRDKIKVIVGGAPVSRDFAEEIGADGFAPDAGSAADLCEEILS